MLSAGCRAIRRASRSVFGYISFTMPPNAIFTSTYNTASLLFKATTSLLLLQAYSVPYEQSQANGTPVYDQPEDSGDEYDASSSSSSSQGPPGFSSTVKASQVIIIDHHLLLLSADCKKLHACPGAC